MADRGPAYNMPGITVDQVEPEAVFDAAGEAVERARAGGGPTLIEAKVFRYYGHFQGDPEPYRPKGEVDSLREQDPIPAYAGKLQQEGLLTGELEQEIRTRVTARIDEAFEFARNSAYPEAEEAFQHVFSD